MRTLIAVVALATACSKKEREQPAPAAPISIDAAPDARGATFVSPEAPVMADGKELPPECAELRRMFAKIATCEKLPAEFRDSLRESFTMIDTALADVDAASRASVAESCRAAVKGMRDAVQTMCDL